MSDWKHSHEIEHISSGFAQIGGSTQLHRCPVIRNITKWDERDRFHCQPRNGTSLALHSGDEIDKLVDTSSGLTLLQFTTLANKTARSGASPERDFGSVCLACQDEAYCRYSMPKIWWSRTWRNSNGYFGSQSSFGEDGTLSTHSYWLQMLVKEIGTSQPLQEQGAIDYYTWHYLDIYVHWVKATGATVALVFNPPQGTIEQLIESPALKEQKALQDPYFFLADMGTVATHLQSQSVWAIRDLVRVTELSRTTSPRTADFRILHNIARHAIHVGEMLEVAKSSLEQGMAQHRALCQEAQTEPSDRVAALHVQQQLAFHIQMFSGMHSRAKSNQQRLLNEITLLFNMVAQQDAQTAAAINSAVRADSAVMRSVAVVSLTFLPATFVSTIFGMSFFDSDESGTWVVSEKVWIYWAVTVPVTLGTLAVWFWFNGGSRFKGERLREDMDKLRALVASVGRLT